MIRVKLLVREAAAEKKISQGKLSRSSDVTPNTLRALYADPYKEVTMGTLVKIANALGVHVKDLFEEEDVSE